MHLLPDLDICWDILSRARLAHFNIPNWARNLLPIAKESGVTIACDLQDVISVDDPYRQDFIQFADIIFFSSANHGHPAQLIDSFLEQKPDLTVVSGMGAEGCALGTSKGIQYFPVVEMDKPVIDTNGAGDGLAVGFLSSYVLGNYSLHQSILRAQITARYTCTQKASSSNLITGEKLDSFYNSMTL
jgi:sugar/nucleoside kinase (ribokinase family)